MGKAIIILITPAVLGQPWYPKVFQVNIHNLILIPKKDNLLFGPNSPKHPGCLQLMDWVVSGKSFLADTINRVFILFNVIKSHFTILTDIFHQGLGYNTICGYRSAIAAYHDSTGPFLVGKHLHVSILMTEIFNKRMPQPKFCFKMLEKWSTF